jgi:tRNA threonylcarbamoyladenosine biosynthesis protein TsaB
MSVTLFIDTSAINTARVRLAVEDTSFEKVSESKKLKSQMVLPLIEDILREHQLKLTDITAIEVATGPGSFTGLRVGASVANALGYLLNIPVNGKKGLVNPTY